MLRWLVHYGRAMLDTNHNSSVKNAVVQFLVSRDCLTELFTIQKKRSRCWMFVCKQLIHNFEIFLFKWKILLRRLRWPRKMVKECHTQVLQLLNIIMLRYDWIFLLCFIYDLIVLNGLSAPVIVLDSKVESFLKFCWNSQARTACG